MALPKLKSLGTYEEINGGAHRKAASIVGVPSLVRHLGFWNTGFTISARGGARTSLDSSEETVDVLDWKSSGGLPDRARQESYRRYIETLRTVITDKDRPGLEPDREAFITDLSAQIDTGTVALIRFWWQTLRMTIRLEYHTEYITLTSIADLSVKKRRRERVGVRGDATAEVIAEIERIRVLFNSPSTGSSCEYDSISQALQISIWETFEREVLNATVGDYAILQDAFGEVFLDSRGIIIGSFEPDGNEAKRQEDAGLVPAQVLRPAFQYELPRRRSRKTIVNGFPGVDWTRGMLSRIWPMVESGSQFGEFEFTVTGFLQGRVLFVTALGPQARHIEGDEKLIPIRYLMHAYTDDEWQLGRLVDRINSLGSLRLAATMEIGALKLAGRLIEALSDEIETTGNTVQRAIQQSKSGQSGDTPQGKYTLELANSQIQKVSDLYQEINDVVSGDIRHRLERAQYYVERFTQECKDLREKRIEGFQMYSEFVTRRMNNIFGYIQFLRTRMNNIESSLSAISRQYSSLKITSVTCGIDELLASLNHQYEKMQEQENEIGKIQEFGEVALIGVLIPYYIGIMLLHIFHLEESPVGPPVLLFIITLFAAILLVRRSKNDWRPRTWGGWLWSVSAAFWLYLAIVWGAFLVTHGRDMGVRLGIFDESAHLQSLGADGGT